MPYTADISRANPALFLFLVVQCFGMAAPMPGQAETFPLQFPSREDMVPLLGDGDSKQMFRLASVLPEGSR